MEIYNENFIEYKFNLHLISYIRDSEFLHGLDNNDDILILNPDYVRKYLNSDNFNISHNFSYSQSSL